MLFRSKLIGANVSALKYVALSETQGIVYTGVVGSLLEISGGDAQGRVGNVRASDDLVDGGVYHLTRAYSDLFYNYLPLITK